MLLLISCCLSYKNHSAYKGHSANVMPNVYKDGDKDGKNPDQISSHEHTHMLHNGRHIRGTTESVKGQLAAHSYMHDISEQYGETFRCSAPGPPCNCHAWGELILAILDGSMVSSPIDIC